MKNLVRIDILCWKLNVNQIRAKLILAKASLHRKEA
jgi:hypothetical protein